MVKWEYRYVLLGALELGEAKRYESGPYKGAVSQWIISPQRNERAWHAFLNAQGEEGWHLVSLIRISGSSAAADEYQFVFKRPRER